MDLTAPLFTVDLSDRFGGKIFAHELAGAMEEEMRGRMHLFYEGGGRFYDSEGVVFSTVDEMEFHFEGMNCYIRRKHV